MNSPRRERLRYRWTNRLLLGGFVLYLLVVFETERVHGREELFPVASWSLFSKVPNEVRDYSLRFVVMRGQRLAEPVYFERASHLLRNTHSHAARISIQRLGRGVAANDAAEVRRVRAYLEDLHLRQAGEATYELVARRYDPLARYRDGAIEHARTLATFHTGQLDAAASSAGGEAR